jgi:small subunit ribosomal protein S20
MKAHRVGERRYARNRPVRSALRTFVKKARGGIATVKTDTVDEATALVAAAAKELDQAASKGIIHKNQAARRKSRLMHQLALATKAAAENVESPAAPAGRATRRRAADTSSAPRTGRTRSSGASGGSSTRTRARKEPSS